MTEREMRIADLGIRMRGFAVAKADDFPRNTIGGQKFAALIQAAANVELYGNKEVLEKGNGRRLSEEKKALRAVIRRQMKVYRETALSIEPVQPGISESFRIPESHGEKPLIAEARSFVERATPLKPLFLSREMSETFLEDLTDAIDSFQACVDKCNLNRVNRSGTTALLRDALSQVIIARRELDAIVRNKYRDDKESLAMWETASHLERAPKKAASSKGNGSSPPTSSPD
jgi:hypothetical protein